MTHRPHIEDIAEILCPYCGSPNELFIEADSQGAMVEDCSTCCRPINIRASRNANAQLDVAAAREDD